MTSAYEAAGLSAAEITCVAGLVAAVESADYAAPWVAVARPDVMGVVALVDRLVDRSAVHDRPPVTYGPPRDGAVTAGTGEVGRVARDPEIMAGVPCVRGTRIPITTILRHLAETDPVRVLADFPQVTRDDLAAVLLYAAAEFDRGEPT